MQRRALALGMMAALVGLGIGAFAPSGWMTAFSRPNWQEVAWPFPQDGWPAGRAFRCNAAACGGALDVYVRPKIGLCNCSVGITGDAEVDAVSDVDMLAADFTPLGPGERVEMAGMIGLARPYQLVVPTGGMVHSAGMALSHRCDLVAAASVGDAAGTPRANAAIASLISRAEIAQWLRDQMGKS